jgi:hypothetical protein
MRQEGEGGREEGGRERETFAQLCREHTVCVAAGRESVVDGPRVGEGRKREEEITFVVLSGKRRDCARTRELAMRERRIRKIIARKRREVWKRRDRTIE